MEKTLASTIAPAIAAVLPRHRQLYAGGQWTEPHGGYRDTWNPATGESLGPCAEADASDVQAVVEEAPLRPNPVTQDEMDAGSIELF